MIMKTYKAGSLPRFTVPSHLGSPTTLNILNEIGEVIISGLPAINHSVSGLYYGDFQIHDRFYPGVYKARWEPVVPSGIQDFGVMSRLGNVVNGRSIADVGRPILYKEMSSMMYDSRPSYRISPYFIEKYAPYADYWLLDPSDVYSGLTETYDVVKQYNPSCKVGAVLYNTIDPRWSIHMRDNNDDGIGYIAYPLVSGVSADSTYWTSMWDNVISSTDLDFYVVSGLEDNTFKSWALNNKKEIIIKTSAPIFDYQSIIYNPSSVNEASKIMASGVYPWVDNYAIAGRTGCGFFGHVGNQGDLLAKSQYETRYEKLTFIDSGITAYPSAVPGEDMSAFKWPKTYSQLWSVSTFLTGSMTVSGLVETGQIREVDYLGFHGTMLWDSRTESGVVSRLKKQWPNMVVQAYVPRYAVFYNGDGQPTSSFTREVYEAFLDDKIDIDGTDHRFVQYSLSGLKLSIHSTVPAHPTGPELKWIRTEKITGNVYSGLCNAYGDRYVYAISGLGYDMFGSFEMPAIELSTHNHIVFEWAGGAQFKPWDHRWRKRQMELVRRWASGSFGYNKVDGVFIDHSSSPSNFYARANPINFVADQTVADNPNIPGASGENPSEVWEWTGYYDLNDNYDPNDLDNTVLNGSYSTWNVWQNDGDPEDLAIWKDYTKKDTHIWVISGMGYDTLNGGYVWNDYNDFVSNQMPLIFDELAFEGSISTGELWAYVQTHNSKIRGNQVVIGSHITLTSTITSRRVAYGLALLCDQVAQPVYLPELYWGTAQSDVWVKPEIGFPINDAHKVGSTICRDFTNGRVEMDDTAINQYSAVSSNYNKIRIWVNNQPFNIN